MVYDAARQQDLEHVTLGPGTARLRHCLVDAAGSCISATGRRKIIVVDGFEAVMADANNAADIAFFVKKSLPAPTILVAHKTRTITTRFNDLFAAAMRSRATVLHLVPPDPDEIAEIVQTVHPHIDRATALSLGTRARGDIRAALASAGMGFVSEKRHGHMVKDRTDESFQLVDAIFDHCDDVESVDDIVRRVTEPGVVSCAMFERYGFSLACIDAMSDADLIDAYMFRHQRFDLWDAYTTMAVAAPIIHIRRERLDEQRRRPHGTFIYGVVWSKMHLHATRSKLAATVLHQRALAMLPRIAIHELALLRDMVLDAEHRRDGPELASVTHGLLPNGLLALMRLFKVKYTQGTHARVVKLIRGARDPGLANGT